MERAPQGPLVVVARARAVLDVLDGGVLTARERRRRDALHHPADRESYAAAHLLVRYCAAAVAGRALATLELVQRCPECGSGDHGRPSVAGLPGLHVSLAHTRGAVVAAADRHPVGVDVEGPPARGAGPTVSPHPLPTYTLTPAEIRRVRSAEDPATAFLRSWVRKECLVKVGAATLDDLSRIEVDPCPGPSPGDGPAIGRFGALHVVDWFDDVLGVAVGVAGTGPPRPGALPAAPVDRARPPHA
ncbi:4'-phosphopantetheinyl transferase [Geodermatophilus saharensis]|uniref:4'-phosphopantetheinyl transferase n=1 Tax=Geodermatophilus saharensis TaxID=1137994 RepID=A0A239E0S6_9ACTN|nr:4'-phosphopantetheinyl transferase superfamily protein [Geodermatophilus saharensis]SNS38325.1 4'-phosphopantetheinyl transferase [Geodermatophilus saharensis]